jgi:3-deoxy-D-manno-octulosonic-acid transferase
MPLTLDPVAAPSRTQRIWAALATAAVPALRLMLRRRAASGKEQRDRLPEREGIDATPRPQGRLIWLHAASVGEAVSALPVVQALPDGVTTVFTTGTVTSARLLAQRITELGLQGRVLHRFVPLDVPAWCGRFLDHWRPDVACFLESELWPNTLAACTARRIPTVLLNARMSVRSAARWCNLPGFAAEIIGGFTWIAAQSEADAMRLRSLGGRRVESPGNLKFAADDLPADPAELVRLAPLLAASPRWLAASTHPGEEAIAAAVHEKLAPSFPGLITAIVPRHPERGPAIAAALGAVPRRGLGQDPAPGLWIADTIGELGLMYRLFPTVFMGKSLGASGGQNPLEPARLACAIATGPATANFADAVAALQAEGGLTVINGEAELAGWVAAMLRDPAARTRAGDAARRAATNQSGLPARMAARLVDLMQ